MHVGFSLESSREHNGERRKEENACAKTVSGGCAIAVAPSRLSFRSHCTMPLCMCIFFFFFVLGKRKDVVISSCLLTLLVDI
jgi:hypothetical protein